MSKDSILVKTNLLKLKTSPKPWLMIDCLMMDVLLRIKLLPQAIQREISSLEMTHTDIQGVPQKNETGILAYNSGH